MNRTNHRQRTSHGLRISFALALGPALLVAACVSVPVQDSRTERAQAYERVGSWPEASVVWTEIYLASSARNIDAGYNAARASFAARRFEESRIRLVDLTTRAPKDARVFELAGLTDEALGDAVSAEAAYRRALELDPERPMSLTRLGALMALAGDFEGGVASLEEGLALDPNDARARYALGVAQTAAGHRERAIAAFVVACKSETVTDEERVEAARLVGADARVAEWLQVVVTNDPQWTEALWRLGEARSLAGHFGAGLELLERAAETDPGDVTALAAYARGLVMGGQLDEARAIIEHTRSLDLTPEEEAVITAVEAGIQSEPETPEEPEVQTETGLQTEPADPPPVSPGR